MTIRQIKTYTPPAGHTNVVTILEWAETLSPEEKLELYRSKRFTDSREKTAVALNTLVINNLSEGVTIYEWASQEALDNFLVDAVYEQYHSRYLSETGITFNIQTETL